MAREMTKLHEEVRRGSLTALAEAYAGEAAPKGEVTVLVVCRRRAAKPIWLRSMRRWIAALAVHAAQARRRDDRRTHRAFAQCWSMPGALNGLGRRMADRRQAEARGHRSEAWAAWWLRLKGHRILGRRVKTHAGEIDLVTLSPFGPVCFIEVKARRNFARCAGSGEPGAADSHCPRRLLISGLPAGACPARGPL